jgi:3-deoxy-alpha-D-manno-octulosonate 8-oxidase
MVQLLDTGVKNVRNVPEYIIGEGSLSSLADMLQQRRQNDDDPVWFFVDDFFKEMTDLPDLLPSRHTDLVEYVSTQKEPTTKYINALLARLSAESRKSPCAIVGFGGGITLDTAKAISNLITNGGQAEDYQGWDLLRLPGVHKIGIPTLSGTGAEATRTCVLTNEATGLKLGMNSQFTVFDQLILDPLLTRTVPRSQYFFTGMDAYIHSFEALAGSYRNAIGDAFSAQAIKLAREVFASDNMQHANNREKLMVASYLGGSAIATSYVGLVHPFSAGLSVVFGLHHCKANCAAMKGMEEYYPDQYSDFMRLVAKQSIDLGEVTNNIENLDSTTHDQLYNATIIHEKPLTNALGEGFKEKLDRPTVRRIFEKILQ